MTWPTARASLHAEQRRSYVFELKAGFTALDEKYAVLPKIRIDGLTAYNETAFKNSHCRTSSPQKRSEQILHVSQAIETAEVTAGGCTLSLPVTVTFCHCFITDFFPPPSEVEEAEPRPSNPSSHSSPSPSAHHAAAPLLQCVKGLGWCQPSKGILVSATNSPER